MIYQRQMGSLIWSESQPPRLRGLRGSHISSGDRHFATDFEGSRVEGEPAPVEYVGV